MTIQYQSKKREIDNLWFMVDQSNVDEFVTWMCCNAGHTTEIAARQCQGWLDKQAQEFPKQFVGKGHQLIEFIGTQNLLHWNERLGVFEWNKDAAIKIEGWMKGNL